VTAVPIITGINAIAQRYDALLCDAWGVIHNGVELFPGAEAAMIRFRETRGPIIVLTNAPRPSSIIPAQLDRLGLSRNAYDAVVTSGDATRAEIEALLPAPAFRIGPAKDDPLFEGMTINFASLDEAGFIICTGLVDDQGETPDDYRDLLGRLAERKLTMICANPDIVVNWGGRMIWCAGALAKIYEEMDGKVVYGGKPYSPIYRLALSAIETARGGKADPSRVLAIGDGLKTDIAGANGQGIDAIYVAGRGGVHDGETDAETIASHLTQAGVHAIAAAEGLRW
jgi:HAD superfamily hydrolase (TIGR01459 family)